MVALAPVAFAILKRSLVGPRLALGGLVHRGQLIGYSLQFDGARCQVVTETASFVTPSQETVREGTDESAYGPGLLAGSAQGPRYHRNRQQLPEGEYEVAHTALMRHVRLHRIEKRDGKEGPEGSQTPGEGRLDTLQRTVGVQVESRGVGAHGIEVPVALPSATPALGTDASPLPRATVDRGVRRDRASKASEAGSYVRKAPALREYSPSTGDGSES